MKNKILIAVVGLILSSLQLNAQDDKGYRLYLQKVQGVNSSDSKVEELSPVISGDGKHMFFVRMGDSNNQGFDEDANNQDIWYSQKEGDQWSTPVNLGAPINNKYHNVVCGTNNDGSVIYLSNTYYFSKKGKLDKMGSGMSYSTRQSDGSWSKPTNITIKGLKKDQIDPLSHFYFHRSADGKVLIFSAKLLDKKDEESAKQNEKIYVCFKSSKKDTYDNIQMLNQKVNPSSAHVTAPYLSKDGSKLYYTSIGGSNNAELYVVKHNVDASKYFDPTPENWTEADAWGEPKPVYEVYNTSVKPIHHAGFEGYQVPYENDLAIDYDDIGYITRSQGGSPADIYIYYFRKYHNFNIEMLEEVDNDGTISYRPISIPNTLKSAQLSESISPKSMGDKYQYTFYEKNADRPNNLAEGDDAKVLDTKAQNYTFDVNYTQPDDYEIIPDKSQTKFEVTSESFDENSAETNVKLVFRKLSTSKFMVTLNFDWDQYYIRSMEREIINQVAQTLKKLKDVEIILSGHTDNTGDPDQKNNQLSTNRAKAAQNLLKQLGGQNEIQVLAYGENKLKEGSGDEEQKSEINRRVELVIKKIPKEQKEEIQKLCNKIIEIRKKYNKEQLNTEDCFNIIEYDPSQSIIQIKL